MDFFSAVLFQLLVIKTPVPDPDLDSLEMLDPNPDPVQDPMNLDPQHC
jgi:hypothetical protein